MNEKREYILEGLCCANCAAKIEKEVGKLSEVNEATINLMNNKLSISLAKEQPLNFTASICKIVASHEPSVKVIDVAELNKDKTSENKKQKENDSKDEVRLYLLRLIVVVAITLIITIVKVPDSLRLIVYLIAYVLAGYETLFTAGRNILKGKVFDENFLMGIASLGAFIIGERTEAIAVLVFYAVGEMIQDRAVNKSKRNIEGLMDIRPDYANKIVGDTTLIVAPEEIEPGDIILVKPGEKIPLDGIVVKGSSFIDAKALTGESVPTEVTLDDTVLSGTINTTGVLEVKVTKYFGESTVSKILEMVQNAGNKKAVSEKFITKFARYYTPAVVLSAIAVAVLPPVLGFGDFTVWLYRALSFLIISCPCALVISIPLSFFGGIGGAAKHGILVKGGNYLDALKQVDTVVFDKTGTLTKGIFEVTKVCPVKEGAEEELLRYAVIAENHSLHPIAKSIITYYNKSNTSEDIPSAQITELAGYGIIADYEGSKIYAGNEKLMKKYELEYSPAEVSGSIVHVAQDDKYLGYIVIADEIKPGAPEAIAALKLLGVRNTVMLTGDRNIVAKDIAQQCCIDEYASELLPQDKVSWFEKYKSQMTPKGRIVFVGDGINDAPVLAGADIGIAMGGIGSDAAIEAADIVIMNDDIGKIVTAIRIARKTKLIVTQNIIFALGIKLLIMILAFMGITSIWFAIFADVGVALLAVFNAMRAMYMK